MKNLELRILALILLSLLMAASHTRAQSIYTSYAFTNFAGLPGVSGTNDGTGSTAHFLDTGTVAFDRQGNFYVTDFGNHTIRKITPAGVVTTLAGLGGVSGTNDGIGDAARFNGPATLDVDSNGVVYVTDYYNHTVRQVTPAGAVTTLAGMPGVPGTKDGIGSAAQFNHPIGVGVDSATNIYIGDSENHTIRKVTSAGVVTTVSGSAGQPGGADGTNSAARFRDPHHVRVDSAGNIFIADTGNNTIRMMTPEGVVTTIAGLAGASGSRDGRGNAARFNQPYGVSITSNGNILVADTFNHTIRRITPDGIVTTIGGRPGFSGSSNGAGSVARFNQPICASMDSAGNLFVADDLNHRITKGVALLQFDTPIGFAVSNGIFQTRLLGPFGSNVVVEASSDLQGWTAVKTNALPAEALDFPITVGTNQIQFLRARLAQ